MSIKGKTRENKELIKETGFFEGQVVAVNPNKEELEKLLGTELDKDIEYTGTTEDGEKKLTISFWLKVTKTGRLKNLRFYLEDVERVSNDKVKKQYINDVGATSWSDKEENLPDWFKQRQYRVARRGEEELYNFVINWLNKLDTKDAEAVLSFDWEKLIRGNVKEIKEQIGGEYEGTLVCLSYVRTVDKEGEVAEYEQVYNKEFLPGYVMKQIRLKKIDKPFIETAKSTERKKRSKLQKFVLNIVDDQYGIKDYYTLGELEEYDASKNIAARDDVKEDDTSY